MSAESEWGSVRPLRHNLFEEAQEEESTSALDPIELHADQEELEYESYADTAMTIPGQGEPGDNCGVWMPFEFCDECGEPEMGMSRCEKRVCPDCYRLWEEERTIAGVQRLAKARYAEDDGIDRRAMHAVMSPPEGEIKTIQQWYDGYREAYTLAQKQGIRGGVVIGHGYRVEPETKREYRRLDLDYGIWRWIREDKPKSWRSYTYWSPHYHVIGLCRDLAENKPEQQDGWNSVRIDSLSAFTSTTDREGVEDMVRRIRYLLDHGTFESETSKDCVRWFGDLATTKFQPDEELSEGSASAIDRLVEEVVGNPESEEGDGEEWFSEEETRQCDNCESTSFSSIFEAGGALMDKGWCERIGREQQRRLQTAFEWAIGEVVPPPGLKNPTTEAEAHETFQELLPSGACHEAEGGGGEVEDINPESSSESRKSSHPATQDVGAPGCNGVYHRDNCGDR